MRLFTRAFIKDLIWIAIFCLAFYVLTHNPIITPKAPVVKEKWSIQLMLQPLVLGLGGHNYLVLRDNENNTLRELHGLATDQKTGTWKYVGNDPKDILQVWEFTDEKTFAVQKGYSGSMLYKGTKDEVMRIWNKTNSCKKIINAKNIPYPPYGFYIKRSTENSNSVAYTLIMCMGLKSQSLGLFTPGWGENLLDNR